MEQIFSEIIVFWTKNDQKKTYCLRYQTYITGTNMVFLLHFSVPLIYDDRTEVLYKYDAYQGGNQTFRTGM